MFEWADIDVKKKLVGFCADGASVNMGRVGGVAVRLAREVPAPWLVVVHCVSYRIELAVNDTFKSSDANVVFDMLLSIYLLYEKSNKRLRELNQLGEIMAEHVSKPYKANGTRWVQHKSRACAILVQNYPVIVTHLEAQSADDANVPAADEARLKGYLRTLKSLKFVLHLLYVKVILVPLSAICNHLQKCSIDLLYVTACLEQLYASLDNIRDEAAHSGGPTAATLGALAQVLEQAEDDPTGVVFSGVNLHDGAAPGIVNAFKAQMPVIANKVKQCMTRRFQDIENDANIGCLKLLDCTLWPRQRDDLVEYGVGVLNSFIEEFRPLLEANNVDIDELHQEWACFKTLWLRNLAHMSRNDLWETVILHYEDTYPNLVHVIRVLMVSPGRRLNNNYCCRLSYNNTNQLIASNIN